jgi:cell division protease FtsH
MNLLKNSLRNPKFMVALGLGLIGIGLLVTRSFQTPAREITYAELDQLMQSKKMSGTRIEPTPYPGIYRIEGAYQGLAGTRRYFITTRLDDAQAKTLFTASGAKIILSGQEARGQMVNIIATVIIAGLIVGVVVFQFNIGRGKNCRVRSRPVERFCDVAGIDEAKAEVQEVVDFIRNPKKYRRLGGNMPKGVLLIGPPGTGKTMLAKAIAGEANASFFSVHGSDFTEVFVGVGARRVRHLFRQAARHKPAIIFIDELDCVGKSRNADTNGEHQQTINALLAAMDGFESRQGVVVVAATNRPADLDEALLRPGRFDRKVHVPYPDRKGRCAILNTHAVGKPLVEASRSLEVIARTTPGMSGADLANLLNEAAMACALQDKPHIAQADLEAARDKVRYGKERKSLVLNPKERELVAYHEAGHTIIHLQTALLAPLYKVSIVPRDQALGATVLLPEEDQNLQSKAMLLEQLRVLMGGRAAERTFFGSTTNGAAGDLDVARKMARKMVHEWGMGEKLYYEAERHDAEQEINRLLEDADQRAREIIQVQKSNTEKLAHALLEQETLTRGKVLALLDLRETGAAERATSSAGCATL